jgi:hypothetical protein
MADTKISALPASTTPLAGTEVLPIVQSGATKQVSVANLTTGRAISATAVTASTGNFIVGTSGQGIDFSATPGTGTSELLADYEEGTWTPALQATGYTFTYGTRSGTYTKVGNLVTFKFYMDASFATGSGTVGLQVTGLPFTSANSFYNYGGTSMSPGTGSSWFTNVPVLNTRPNATFLELLTGFNSSGLTYQFNVSTMPNNTEFQVSGFYYV